MNVGGACRSARCLGQALQSRTLVRQLAVQARPGTSRKKQWPRLAIHRQQELPRDPEKLVRQVHEKERDAFRDAVENRDFAGAYQIYEEQRGLPILSGAEVTSLIQLIAADATLRKWNGYEQPESLYDVFCTIIDDVKQRKVAGQCMLWAHALDVLVTWERLDEGRELWQYLEKLPNRLTVDKNEALCIDSRVYGSALKLYTALKDMPKVEALYKEALEDRHLRPSLMLEQAMIQALFQDKRIGEAYKHMDKTIREQRRALGPGFFGQTIALALEAKAVGVATEIFMKACKISMPPPGTAVTRLLAALGRSRTYSLRSVMTIFKQYRATAGGRIPVEHINCVIDAMFKSIDHDVSRSEVLARVHQLLKEMQESGIQASTSTINILLRGYISIDAQELADDLLSHATLNENSFRAVLKAYAQTANPSSFAHIRSCWTSFLYFLSDRQIAVSARDVQMLMRAAFSCDGDAARDWLPQVLARIEEHLTPEESARVQAELQHHEDGTFLYIKQQPTESDAGIQDGRLLAVHDNTSV